MRSSTERPFFAVAKPFLLQKIVQNTPQTVAKNGVMQYNISCADKGAANKRRRNTSLALRGVRQAHRLARLRVRRAFGTQTLSLT